MTASRSPETSERAVRLALAALERPLAPFRTLPEQVVVVDVNRQRLSLLRAGEPMAEYRISTSAVGVGGEEGSFRTPPGWHRIHSLIGAGAERGTIFESREPSGRLWRDAAVADDLILTRIIRLEGVEPGVNRGAGRDSLERFIYIHGTNHEGALGRPASHGCVRMASADIEALFDAVREGDAVIIVEEDVRERT